MAEKINQNQQKSKVKLVVLPFILTLSFSQHRPPILVINKLEGKDRNKSEVERVVFVSLDTYQLREFLSRAIQKLDEVYGKHEQ